MNPLHVLCVLMFVTSVLTLVTKKETKLDLEQQSTNNTTSKTVDKVTKDPVDDSKISSKTNLSTEKIDNSSISNVKQFILEGGGKIDLVTSAKFETSIIPDKNSSHSTVNKIEEANKNDKNSKDSNDQKNIEQKKSNIKPRKGVGNETLVTDGEITLKKNKFIGKLNKTTDSMVNLEKSTVKIPVNLNNTSQHLSTVTMKMPLKNTTEKVKKHKLKPTVTIGGVNVDKPIPASPTKSPPLGMPRKIDYVVPIMITIFTVPLLSVATYILYRRGRDCWDKRHYRRMDFLIDGMYNE